VLITLLRLRARRRYRYLPPVIHNLTGPGVYNASTRGGQVVVISGLNFGPYDPRYSLQVTYGKSGVEFTAQNCSVTHDHVEIT
jgi:hypothetical protein